MTTRQFYEAWQPISGNWKPWGALTPRQKFNMWAWRYFGTLEMIYRATSNRVVG